MRILASAVTPPTAATTSERPKNMRTVPPQDAYFPRGLQKYYSNLACEQRRVEEIRFPPFAVHELGSFCFFSHPVFCPLCGDPVRAPCHNSFAHSREHREGYFRSPPGVILYHPSWSPRNSSADAVAKRTRVITRRAATARGCGPPRRLPGVRRRGRPVSRRGAERGFSLNPTRSTGDQRFVRR